MQTMTILGAGPAGLLLAHYLLAQDNYHITLYDRRPDPRDISPDHQRTFPLSIQLRGLAALAEIPWLAEILGQRGLWSQGAYIHQRGKASRKIQRNSKLLLIDRYQLTLGLLEHLIARDTQGRVTLHFGQGVQAVDLNDRRLCLENSQGEQSWVTFDYLVGADGARSVVRQALVDQGTIACDEWPVNDVYKTVSVQRVRADGSAELDSHHIHTWRLPHGVRLIMVPQADGWLSGTLIFDPKANPLAHCSSPEEILAYFQHWTPNLAQTMTLEDAAALEQRPIAQLLTVRCDRFHADHAPVVLIGDAIHAVSASIGQGCNAALQDAQILAQILDRHHQNWEQALPAFTQERRPDAHALQELSDYSFPRSKILATEFFFRLTVGKRLSQWFPAIAPPQAMKLVMDTTLPYSQVLDQSRAWIDRVKATSPKP